MGHWKLTLSYNGSGFHGWQVQPGLATVQGVLADALKQITGTAVLPQGAGRTDAGVHALGQIASFALPTPIPAANLQRALNRILPAGLRVLRAELVPPSFHARHSARGKIYEYRIFERRLPSVAGSDADAERICSPFLAPFVWDCRWPLDLELLQRAATCFVGTHDFSAMAASGRTGESRAAGSPARGPAEGDRNAAYETPESREQQQVERRIQTGGNQHRDIRKEMRGQAPQNPVKTIFSSSWTRSEGLLIYRVHGSGFLHHMVRNLVGTAVDIGRGSLKPEGISEIILSRDRSQAGPTAPASGLYLVEVLYGRPPFPQSDHTREAELCADAPMELSGAAS